mgnify:CR=1 FL=1
MKKKFALILIIFFGVVATTMGQTTIAVQDFDGATPAWNYTVNPATYNISSDYWTIRAFNNAPTGTDGNFWAIRDLNNPNGGGDFDHTLTLDDVDVSAYNANPLTISFRYYTIGFDSADYLKYQIAYDGGAYGTPVNLLKNTGEKKEKTEWHRIVVFNEGLVNVIQQYLKKGAQIYVEGQLTTRKWKDEQSGQDKYSTEIVLQGYNSTLTMLGGGNNAGGIQNDTSQQNNIEDSAQVSNDMDDEIPF